MKDLTKPCHYFHILISVLILVIEAELKHTSDTGDECPSAESAFSQRIDANRKQLREFLEKENQHDEPRAVHKARRYYSLCMKTSSNLDNSEIIRSITSKIGLPQLIEHDDELLKIIKTVPIRPSPEPENADFDCAQTLARATRITGIETMPLTVTPSPFNQSINVIRLIRPAYTSMLLNLRKDRNYKLTKKDVIEMTMEQPIKEEERPKLRSIPELHTLQGIQDITTVIAKEENSPFPAFNWTRFIEEMFADLKHLPLKLEDPTDMRVIIDDWDDIKMLIRNIHRVNRTVIEKATVHEIAKKFLFFIIDGSQNELQIEGISHPSFASPESCTRITIFAFEMAVAYAYKYLEMKYHSERKEEVRVMVEYTRESFAKIIKQSTWMDKKTKENALKKLKAMKSYVGYQNVLDMPGNLEKLYNNVNITENFLETTLQLEQNKIKIKLNKLNVLNDPSDAEWFCPPTTENAYYKSTANEIMVPSGILGTPLYTDCSKALNFGSIGMVVGHEMSHGFDTNGRLYNERGIMEDWWNKETVQRYNERVKCFKDAYDKYNVTINRITMKSNSSKTINEDIADNGGFKAILHAYRSYSSKMGKGLRVPKFEKYTHEQLFTLGFATFWCESHSKLTSLGYEGKIKRDKHSPNKIRVNGVLMNSEEFPSIWNCPRGSNMNPFGEKCSLW